MNQQNLLNTPILILNRDSSTRFSRMNRNHSTDDICVTICTNMLFNIKLVDCGYIDSSDEVIHKPAIYSVISSSVIEKATFSKNGLVTKNNVYTIYIPENMSWVDVSISFDDSDHIVYRINRRDNNVINDENSHYIDEITNQHLPGIEELLSAVEPSVTFESREILKRLLLDINHIRNNKGTQHSLEKVFAFLGYDTRGKQIKFLPEFQKPDGKLTINPDMMKDIKTGEYYVIYRLYEMIDEMKLDKWGMPDYKISVFGSDLLWERMLNAIAMINKYFCIQEQHIKTITNEMMVNIPLFNDIGVHNKITFNYNTQDAYERLKLKMYTISETVNCTYNDEVDGIHRRYITSNAMRTQINPRRISFIRDLSVPETIDANMVGDLKYNACFCREELMSCKGVDPSILGYDSRVGEIYHIEFDSPGKGYKYICYCLFDKKNSKEMSNLISDDDIEKSFLMGYDTPKYYPNTGIRNMQNHNHLRIACMANDPIYVMLNVIDPYNNTTSYVWKFWLKAPVFTRLKIFNSSYCDDVKDSDGNYQTNGIQLGPDSTYPLFKKNIVKIGNIDFPLYQLTYANTPDPLDTYHNPINPSPLHYYTGDISEMDRMEDPIINAAKEDTTTTLPMKYMYQTIDIGVINPEKYTQVFDLVDRLKINGQYYKDITGDLAKKLYFNVLPVDYDRAGMMKDVFIISTMETGISLSSYKFTLDGVEIPKEDINISTVQLFYDTLLPLDDRFNALKISPDNIIEHKDVNNIPVKSGIIYSVFPRLAERDVHPKYSIMLKLNDIVVCYLDPRYVHNPTNIEWTIKDHYTGDVYYKGNDFSVRYRVKHKTSYDIICRYYSTNIFNKDYKTQFYAGYTEKSAFICL